MSVNKQWQSPSQAVSCGVFCVPIRVRRPLGVLVLLLTGSLSYAESETASAKEPTEDPLLTIAVVDSDGRPVAGALLGQRVVSMDSGETSNLYGLGDPEKTPTTDEAGLFHLRDAEIARQVNDPGIAVCAYHPDRKLIGLTTLTSQDLGTTKSLAVAAGCDVHAKIESSELESLGHPLGRTTIMLFWDEFPHQVVAFSSSKHSRVHGRVHVLLPAGGYRLSTLGDDLLGTAIPEVRIESGEREREITIDLPASQLARMIGKPPPELTIKEWKNGGPVTFADLRGKVVLIDFWGYWCGGCVQIMPELFKLHDQYADKGLVIISVHDDSVASIEEMDNKLARTRDEFWEGRDLPFLVALDGGGKTKIPGTDDEVDGETTAAYGILKWPTTFLIDQSGNVVGPVSCFTDECRKNIEELLSTADD